MSDDELRQIDAPVLHIPTCVGAVAVIYNFPGNPVLNLDPIALADLFQGNIQKWSDTRLAAVNGPDTLPNMDVTIVHRSDSSGTTYIMTDYLLVITDQTMPNMTGKELAGKILHIRPDMPIILF